MVPIVEESGIPQFVSTPSPLMEIKVVATVEHVNSVKDVFACVRMDNVKKDCDSHSVSSIDELHKLFGCSISARSSKERSDLISERSIVSVFLDSHKLDYVVSKLLYPRKDVCGKLGISSNSIFCCADTHMRLINPSRLGLLGARVLENVFLLGIPEYGVIYRRNAKVLSDTLDPCWKAIHSLARRELKVDLQKVRICKKQEGNSECNSPLLWCYGE